MTYRIQFKICYQQLIKEHAVLYTYTQILSFSFVFLKEFQKCKIHFKVELNIYNS